MKQPQLSVDLAPHEQQLGKYRLVAKLGQGGMGTVYLALASGLGSFRKLLVVKELRHDLPWRESSLSMFLDEAQLAARLDHPNVLQTFEAGEAGGRYFLAMEYLDGQPLSSLIDHGVPLELHVYILCEVLQGLQYAHDLTDYDGTRLHVVHRDVSPQNVFVTHHGQVKVVDFGVAKANNGSNITSPGVFKGKFAYAAPEQLFGRPVDGRCDVFAVGVMLWEAIAGRRFGVPKPTVDAFRVRTQGLEPRILQVTPDVDPLLAEICDHALAVDPLERVESAEVLRARLHEWLDLQGEHIQGKHVAEFMRERFSDERAVRQRIVERAMVDAGASQSTIAALPRELFDRESGMSPRVEHDSQRASASGISPAHAAAPPKAARQDARDVHAQQQGVPQLSQVDESVHAANVRRAAAQMKQPSRLSSAAVLVIVAAAVFGLTYQLSRKATEPEAGPQLRSVGAPERAAHSTETSASPATTRGEPEAQRSGQAASSAAPRESSAHGVASGSSEPRELAREQNAGEVARDQNARGPTSTGIREAQEAMPRQVTREAGHAGAREAREPATRGNSGRAARDLAPRERSERGAAQASSAQTALGRDQKNEAREPAAVSGTRSPASQPRAAALPAAKASASARPTTEDLSTAADSDPTKAAGTRMPVERTPAAKARPAGRDSHMGGDIRQLRSGGPMRIDTEDPYK